MAWPPTIPPNTRQNVTPELDNHPSDHNLVSDALTEMSKRVVLDSGVINTGTVALSGGNPMVAGSITIAPVAVPSRVLINCNVWITCNAAWQYVTGVGLVSAAPTMAVTTPSPQLLATAAIGMWQVSPITYAVDLAANANPSLRFYVTSVAGGGTASALLHSTYYLVAR